MLNFNSHHTFSAKLRVVIDQFERVQQICNNTKTLVDGEEIVRETMKNSNYPVRVIEKVYSISIINKKEKKNICIKDFLVLRLLFVNDRTTNVVKMEL